MILNRFNRPKLITCFKEIPKFQRQIKLGIVHEIYVNTDHPEKYTGYIPNVCSEKLKSYATRYQTVFFFRIWSIWKERKYIKLYSSIQLWELHPNNLQLAHGFGKYSKQDFVLENEATYAAKEFFQVAYEEALSGAYSIYEGKIVLFYDYLSAFEASEEKAQKVA